MERDGLTPPSRTAFVAGFMHQMEHYKRLVFRFWWIPLLLGGACFGAEWYFLKRAKPSFTSTGKMTVNVQVSMPGGNVFQDGDPNNFYGTQVALMESDTVKSRVEGQMRTNHPEMTPEHVAVNVSIVPKTSLFALKATGGSPGYTQTYLQTTMDEYRQLKKDMLENASKDARARMEEELTRISQELAQDKKAVVDFQTTNAIALLQPTEGNTPADILAKRTHALEDDKADLQIMKGLTLDQNLEREKSKAAQANGALKDKGNPDNANTAPAAGNVTSTNTEQASGGLPANLGDFEQKYLLTKEELLALESDREQDVKARMTPEHYTPMAQRDEKIARDKKMLDFYRDQAQVEYSDRQKILEARIHTEEDMVKAGQTNALDASKSLAAFNDLKENQARAQVNFDQMKGNLQRLEVDKGIGGEGVTIMEAAGPAMMVPPEDVKHLVVAVITGLLLGVGALLFLDRLDDRAYTFTELEQLFDLPVLGQFPLMKVKKDGTPILRLDDNRYPVIESYRSMRSALLYQNSVKEQPKSIMITSARPSDGKSTVSSNFAVTLALAGAHVLLIDADLRRGVLHKNFSVGSSPGLAEVLGGRCDWGTAVVPTLIPNLDLLPCGKYAPDPGHLFATAGRYLADIPRNYDYYIFDTVPVMVGDDVLSLAPHVDALIMVIRAGFTSGRLARAALNSLEARQVKVVGLVFNGVQPGGSDYYHYKFKDYYPRTAQR